MYLNIFQLLTVPLLFVLSWAIFGVVDGNDGNDTAWPFQPWLLSVPLGFLVLSTVLGRESSFCHFSYPQLFLYS